MLYGAIWLGQLVSLLGSALTTFGLSIYMFEQTGQVEAMATLVFVRYFPLIYGSFFVGPLIDRWDRRTILIAANGAVGLTSAGLFWMIESNTWSLALIYSLLLLSGVFECFQTLTFQSTISTFVKKAFYGRANSLVVIIESLPRVVGPVLAAALLAPIGLKGILLIDIASFAIATVPLLVIKFPKRDTQSQQTTFYQDLFYGVRFIRQRKPLLKLQALFSAQNFLNGLLSGLLAAFILIKTDHNTKALAMITSSSALGALVGGLTISWLNINRRRIEWLFWAMLLAAVLGRVAFGFANGPWLWSGLLFIRMACHPVIGSMVRSIWQDKVQADRQGRVFSAQRLLGQGSFPLAILLGGWLTERIFNDDLNMLSLTGAGSGIAFFFVIIGLAELATVIVGYLSRDIRHVESRVPNHDDEERVAHQFDQRALGSAVRA